VCVEICCLVPGKLVIRHFHTFRAKLQIEIENPI
jgi:hypothetical protein